jgi:hypothetical protein
MGLIRHGSALENMTSNHRNIQAGSAFCWLYDAWAGKANDRGIVALPKDAKVVEVGCGGCHSLGYLLDVAPKGWTIYSIDPYVGEGRFRDWIRTMYERLGDVCDRVNFIRFPSPQAASLFEHQSLDAVMIDGDHDYGPVQLDLRVWTRKVKPGGYIAGDDVDPMFSGCEQAWVEEFGDITCWGSTAVVRL